MTADLRIKVALVAAFATVVLLSLVSALGYVAMVDAARQSQLDLLDDRLAELERRLAQGDELSRSLQLDLSLQVIRVGQPVPESRAGVLQVVRQSDDPDVEALVGRVSTREIDQTLATVRTALWISVLVVGLLVGAAAWFVVDRALAPVRRLTARARAIEANQSLDLLPVTDSGDEIAELAATFNTMLAKLRTADFERRRFVSDASHELRTPLMVLTADAEYTLSQLDAGNNHGGNNFGGSELARSVLTQSERLTGLVDDLLTLASIDEGRYTQPAVSTVAALVERVGADGVVEITIQPQVAECLIPDIYRALANIAANAHRHASTRVAVTAETGDPSHDDESQTGAIIIVVDDDGPGVPADLREFVFERFARVQDARTRDDGGAGLGLAITRDIVERHGGTIVYDIDHLDGARFVIDIPTDDIG